MSSTAGEPSRGIAPTDRDALEVQHLQVEVEKLRLEVEALRSSTLWDKIIGRYLPLLTAILAVAGFWFGVIQYYAHRTETERQRTSADLKRSEELRREAARPFWDSQLQLYLRASEAAATVATSSDAEAVSRAEAQFWNLYWGPLAIVEDVGTEKKVVAEVEAAMVTLGRYLREHPKDRDQAAMQRLSLDLAHAMRNGVGPSFDLKPTKLSGERTE
ncbi:MAG TPA: hypothetical protein VFB96_14725 [Pirellulaceae bacterium]|nr:hypothetical protein [Pirellulaceae bacterium]